MKWDLYFEYFEGELHRFKMTKPVGSINNNGYVQVELNNVTYMYHRIVWEMHNGPIPIGMHIDHIDRNRLNNKIENLRLATRSQNRANSKLHSNSTTGFKGVHKTPSGKFQARISDGTRKRYIGLFDSAEEAAEAYKFVAKELHGEFAIS
jgi:hypothetical protein